MLLRFTLISLLILALAAGRQEAQTAPPEDMYITDRPERTIEAVDKIYGAMARVAYQPPRDRWRFLPHTLSALRHGGSLTVVSLGDSIVNDTCRSGWPMLVQRNAPRVSLTAWTVVRGSTGCWWYRENPRVERYVLDKKPDLVLIGGISHHDDIDAIREVIRQIRAGSRAEILLMTGPFGQTDPNDSKWKPEIAGSDESYRARLKRLSAETKTGFLDMEGAWGAYVRASGKEVGAFKRDVVHANESGEQILGRILERFFNVQARR